MAFVTDTERKGILTIDRVETSVVLIWDYISVWYRMKKSWKMAETGKVCHCIILAIGTTFYQPSLGIIRYCSELNFHQTVVKLYPSHKWEWNIPSLLQAHSMTKHNKTKQWDNLRTQEITTILSYLCDVTHAAFIIIIHANMNWCV